MRRDSSRWSTVLAAAWLLAGCDRPAPPAPDLAQAPLQLPRQTTPQPGPPGEPAPGARQQPPPAAAGAGPQADVATAPVPPQDGGAAEQEGPPAATDPAPPGARAPRPLARTAQPGDPEGAQLFAQRRLVVPVQGVAPEDLTDTYDARRAQGGHEAIDIVAPAGTPVVAAGDGTIAKLFTSKAGGLSVYQFDLENQLAYYYGHLDSYAPGLTEGMAVKRGDPIGTVGSSGNASAEAPHLHFGVFRLRPGLRWWEGDAVNPYPALRRAEPARQREESLARGANEQLALR